MAETILMPRQGNTVESCALMKWRVKEGDEVNQKTIVADVETDKATFEIEAGCSGIVLKLLHPEGADVPVMQAIAVIGRAGEDISALGAASPASASVATPGATAALITVAASSAAIPSAAASSASTAAIDPPAGNGVSAMASPRARHLAAAKGLDAGSLTGTGPAGRVIERDVRAALGDTAPATAAAIEAALKRGLRLPVQGSGLGGRVTLADLQAAPAVPGTVPEGTVPGPIGRDFPGPTTETKIRSIRKVIAERMAESLSTTAQFTLNASAIAVRLQELRQRFKISDPALGLTNITIGDILVYATARTLKRFPYMNAHKIGDSIFEFANVHIGVACDTPRGLMVPVLRNADVLTLKEISDEIKRLSEACRAGSVKPEELVGSTFSISNLGATGVESFTPVLNAPEVAILGICAIGPKPVQHGKEVVFLASVGLSLTINHMVVDGAPAARFLKELCAAIGEVDLLLAI